VVNGLSDPRRKKNVRENGKLPRKKVLKKSRGKKSYEKSTSAEVFVASKIGGQILSPPPNTEAEEGIYMHRQRRGISISGYVNNRTDGWAFCVVINKARKWMAHFECQHSKNIEWSYACRIIPSLLFMPIQKGFTY
jgi:hypothetical protein